jgi:purine nucleoside phosphorylase
MGPNGRALYSIRSDLKQLPDDLFDHIGVIGGSALYEYMKHLRENPSILDNDKFQVDSKTNLIRKLSVVKDTDGKSRVIAMADYWSQTCLIPLHKTIMGL